MHQPRNFEVPCIDGGVGSPLGSPAGGGVVDSRTEMPAHLNTLEFLAVCLTLQHFQQQVANVVCGHHDTAVMGR